jgi:single-strand DNA-binding protein
MAKSVNKVILLGNVGKDPELKAAATGTVVATFSIATSDRFKDKEGTWQDRTEWHNLVAFGKVAEIIRDYVKKGSKLYVEGSLRTQSWDDKTSGQKRYKTEIVVNDLSLRTRRRRRLQQIQHRLLRSARPRRRLFSVHRNHRRRHPVLTDTA